MYDEGPTSIMGNAEVGRDLIYFIWLHRQSHECDVYILWPDFGTAKSFPLNIDRFSIAHYSRLEMFHQGCAIVANNNGRTFQLSLWNLS
jgi:hypothetical protein